MTRHRLTLLSLAALCGCDSLNDETIISASACAEMVNGEVAECEVEKETLKEFEEFRELMAQLDKEHPLPAYLDDEESSFVIVITSEGNLILENGVELVLAGLECDPAKLRPYLVAYLQGEDPYKVSYIATGYSEGNSIFAYVWEMPTAEIQNLEKHRQTPNWDSLNEVALSNRWCIPIEQSGHKYHKRFIQRLEFYD